MSKKKFTKKTSAPKGIQKKHLEEFDITDGKERDEKHECFKEKSPPVF